MALAQLGKQLAQQVVGEKIQDVMDSLRPPDAAKILDPAKQEKPAAPAPGETLGSVIVGQMQAMQRACKEDQELVVLCSAGLETLRVLEIFCAGAAGAGDDRHRYRPQRHARDFSRGSGAAGVQSDERAAGRKTGARSTLSFPKRSNHAGDAASRDRFADARDRVLACQIGPAGKAAMPAAGGWPSFRGSLVRSGIWSKRAWPGCREGAARDRVAHYRRSRIAPAACHHICPFLDREAGSCLIYDHRPVACRTYGFYVERDRGLYCGQIESRVNSGEFGGCRLG